MSNYYFSGTWEVAQWWEQQGARFESHHPQSSVTLVLADFTYSSGLHRHQARLFAQTFMQATKKIHKVKMCISFNHYFSSVLKLFYERIVMSCVVNMWTGHLSLFICFFKRKQTILFLLYIPIQVSAPPPGCLSW